MWGVAAGWTLWQKMEIWIASFTASNRVFCLWLILFLAIVSCQAQATLPCTSTPLSSEEVYGRCTNISLATLKDDANTLFDQEASQHTQLLIAGTTDMVLQSNNFASFPLLNILNILSVELSVIERAAFSGLPHLTYLRLDSTNLSVLSMSAFHLSEILPTSLTLELRNDRGSPVVLNSDLAPFLMSLSDLILDATVVCDCHIVWLIEVLQMFNPLPIGSVTCSSSNPSLDGLDLRNADVATIRSSCPDICNTTLNECDKVNGNCTALTMDSIQCSCLPGFDGNGYVCEDIDECSMTADPCPGEQCSNTIGSYTCVPCAMKEMSMNRLCICRVGLTRSNITGECICNATGSVFDSDTRACICEDSLAVYDSASGTCLCSFGSVDSNTPGSCVCPETKTEIGGRCTCAGDMVEDGSGLCVCPENKTEVNGSCVCPGELVEDQSGVCVCPGNTVAIGGSCMCPGELVEDGPSQCVCPGNKTEVNGSCTCTGELVEDHSGSCVCPGNTILIGGSCVCDGELVANGTGLCVCPGNTIEVNDSCVCPGELVEDQPDLCVCPGNKTEVNGSCICTGDLVEDQSGSCVCPGNTVAMGGSCMCLGELVKVGSDLCVCPGNKTEVHGSCVCPGELVEDQSGVCVCPGNKTEVNDRCTCTGELVEDQSGVCVCPGNTVAVDGSCMCPGELVEDQSGVCVCPGNKTEVNGRCTCTGELVEDQSGVCVCPGNTVAVDGSCMCPGDLIKDGPSRCVCPGNRTEVNGNCTCPGELVEDQFGSCICPGNTVLVNGSCLCDGELVEYGNGVCGCPGNKTEVDGSCICTGELVEDQTGLCVCPEGQQYSTEFSRCDCPFGKEFNESLGRCVCEPPYQSNVDTGACDVCNGEECPSALDQLLRQLTSQELSPMSIQSVAEAAQDQVQDGNIEAGAITTLVSIINSASNVLGNLSSDGRLDVAESIVNLTSALLTEDVVDVWIAAGNISSNVQSLLMAVETVAVALVDVANESESGIVTIVTENIVLRIAIPRENSTEWQSFSTAALTGDPMTASNVILPPSIVDYASCDAAIVSSAFLGVHRLLLASPKYAVPSNEERIHPALCPARIGRINSAIVSTSIVADCNVTTSSIDDAVNISLYHENSALESPVCVSDGGKSGTTGLVLNGEGCMVISSTATRTECSCSHLTSFAILMHPSDVTTRFFSLNYVSKAGLCLSIICLLLTVVILWMVKVKSDLPKVHRQLALSLLLTELVFLIGVDRQAVPSPDGLCTTFAAVIHYLLLVTFTWMLIEGVHMFIMIVVVFFSKKIYIVFYFLGWGLPIIIVGITLGVRFCDYGSPNFCWISSQPTVWGAVLGPIVAVLLVNLVILIIVTVIVIRAKRKQDKNANLVIVSLRTAIVLYPILGFSWISGFLIFGDDPTYIQVVEWFFFVLVTLQGVVIFFMNCIFNKEVREALLKKLGRRETTLAPPSYHNMRRRSTMVSLKTSLRKMSVSSTRRRSSGTCGDITELTLKESTNSYTVARPAPLSTHSPLSDVIVEEDELSTSVVDREPQRVDPATGMLEVHYNTHAECDD